MSDSLFKNTLEQLESRIAPAAGVTAVDFGPPTIVDSHTLTFKELDGDNVTIKFSKGILDSDDAIEKYFTFETYGGDLVATDEGGWYYGAKLLSVDLSQLNAKKFRGLSVSITAEPPEILEDTRGDSRSDGHVNVGSILAEGVDLGNVLVDGSLEQISAGDSNASNGGLKSLTLDYLAGYYDGEGYYSAVSTVVGAIKSLNIHNDIDSALLKVIGGKKAGIGEAVIGGSLLGSYDDYSGSIYVTGSIGKISVGGNLEGSWGKYSGSILADGNIGSAHIAGSILGGDSYSGYSGIVQADGKIGSATVVGDIYGGSSERAGMIHGGLAIGKVEVQGSIYGGEGYASGRIETAGRISEVVVGGNIVGGTDDYAGSIMSVQTIKSVTLDGDLEGTNYRGAGSVFSEDGIDRLFIDGDLLGSGGHGSGSVQAAGVIKALSLTGDLTGGDGDGSGSVLSLAGTIKKVTFDGVDTAGAGELSGAIVGYVGAEISPSKANFGGPTLGGSFQFDEMTGTLNPIFSGSITTYVPDTGSLQTPSGVTFSVIGFESFGSTWSSSSYQFAESTGILTSVGSSFGSLSLNSGSFTLVDLNTSHSALGGAVTLRAEGDFLSGVTMNWAEPHYVLPFTVYLSTPEVRTAMLTDGPVAAQVFSSQSAAV